ncbi:MAG: preprotein translocase subunit SecY [Eubacteriales bacterium]
MKQAIAKIRDIWGAVEIRKKILFTAFILLIYQFGSAIPVPFVSSNMQETFNALYGDSILEYLNLLSGSALSQATLLALGISPYITASIVIQLLTVAIPKWQRMSKEEDGKKKLTQYTRIGTMILAVVTGFAYYNIIKSSGMLNPYATAEGHVIFCAIVIIACFCAGTSIVMWLGEKINDHGIGNGISMILFANIIAGFFRNISSIWNLFTDWGWGTAIAVVGVIGILAIIVFIIFVTNSERRIPVQYSKRVVGRKMYGGQNTNLPLKLNMNGVMPVIFSSSIVSLPATIGALCGVSKSSGGFWGGFMTVFEATSPLYIVLYLVLIVAFGYFYTMITFDPVEVSNNLKRNGGTILGIRPGAPTAEYIKKILNRITLIGSLFLIIVAGLPLIINAIANVLPESWGLSNISGLAFGGTSLLIVIGVALETYRDIEAQMSMRHYKGFLQ